jgi:hypothetical protein
MEGAEQPSHLAEERLFDIGSARLHKIRSDQMIGRILGREASEEPILHFLIGSVELK